MTKLEQAAMQQALEALVNLPEMCGIEEAITVLREALAKQAEQEPVAYKPYKVNLPSFMHHRSWHIDEIQKWLDELPPLYIGPVRTKDLTDDEWQQFFNGKGVYLQSEHAGEVARAVIAADREKNRGTA